VDENSISLLSRIVAVPKLTILVAQRTYRHSATWYGAGHGSRPENADGKRFVGLGGESRQDSPEFPTVAQVQVLRRCNFPEGCLLREVRQVPSMICWCGKDASTLFGFDPWSQIVRQATLLGDIELQSDRHIAGELDRHDLGGGGAGLRYLR
jgi:hypothetical protein